MGPGRKPRCAPARLAALSAARAAKNNSTYLILNGPWVFFQHMHALTPGTERKGPLKRTPVPAKFTRVPEQVISETTTSQTAAPEDDTVRNNAPQGVISQNSSPKSVPALISSIQETIRPTPCLPCVRSALDGPLRSQCCGWDRQGRCTSCAKKKKKCEKLPPIAAVASSALLRGLAASVDKKRAHSLRKNVRHALSPKKKGQEEKQAVEEPVAETALRSVEEPVDEVAPRLVEELVDEVTPRPVEELVDEVVPRSVEERRALLKKHFCAIVDLLVV